MYKISIKSKLNFSTQNYDTFALAFFPLLLVRCIYFEQRAVQSYPVHSTHKNTTTIKILKAKVENPSR